MLIKSVIGLVYLRVIAGTLCKLAIHFATQRPNVRTAVGTVSSLNDFSDGCILSCIAGLFSGLQNSAWLPNVCYPRRARSALGVDTVLTLDVCLYVCMLVL